MWRFAVCAVVSMFVLVHCQETKTADDKLMSTSPEKRLLKNNAGNESTHMHIHEDMNLSSSDENIKRNESEYFVSALFKKYNSTTDLTMDGFARLVCRLGLVPTPLTETTKRADDIFNFPCDNITFTQLQAAFKAHHAKINEREHQHAEGSEHAEHPDISDSHYDHDHNPNRQNRKSLSTSATYHFHDNPANDGHGHTHNDTDESSISAAHHSSQNHSKTAVDITPKSSQYVKRKRRAADIKNGPSLGKSTSSPAAAVHDHQCMSPGDLLQQFHIPLTSLSARDFVMLCPALIYQLDSGACKDTEVDFHPHDDAHTSHTTAKVWGFSTLAVLLISLAGLLGVAAIPIMQKVFYNHLLSFLVAVAVGALSGDALLHLLPHAISKNLSQHHHNHNDNRHNDDDTSLDAVWKGLVALFFIFFFFIMERVLTIVTEKKRRLKNIARLKNRHCEELCDAEKTGRVGAMLTAQASDYTRCDQMVMVVHPNKALKGYADATHDVLLHQCDESTIVEQTLDTEDSSNNVGNSSTHHHHHHGHAHGHAVPGSVAAVAWMVILGDGIHNFSDGLAIGASFANSVTGGLSTSIAVMCHELPHEIGDFAVLLRAGMSVKQAIIYNCVSSVLCFLGMVVGVAIGNIKNATLWIFAGVGGMFLYISMVDMLPEMTAVDTKQGENQYLHLLIQVGGMLLGSGIMLLIAVYEHNLQIQLG